MRTDAHKPGQQIMLYFVGDDPRQLAELKDRLANVFSDLRAASYRTATQSLDLVTEPSCVLLGVANQIEDQLRFLESLHDHWQFCPYLLLLTDSNRAAAGARPGATKSINLLDDTSFIERQISATWRHATDRREANARQRLIVADSMQQAFDCFLADSNLGNRNLKPQKTASACLLSFTLNDVEEQWADLYQGFLHRLVLVHAGRSDDRVITLGSSRVLAILPSTALDGGQAVFSAIERSIQRYVTAGWRLKLSSGFSNVASDQLSWDCQSFTSAFDLIQSQPTLPLLKSNSAD